jgi:hypothetical protein
MAIRFHVEFCIILFAKVNLKVLPAQAVPLPLNSHINQNWRILCFATNIDVVCPPTYGIQSRASDLGLSNYDPLANFWLSRQMSNVKLHSANGSMTSHSAIHSQYHNPP